MHIVFCHLGMTIQYCKQYKYQYLLWLYMTDLNIDHLDNFYMQYTL